MTVILLYVTRAVVKWWDYSSATNYSLRYVCIFPRVYRILCSVLGEALCGNSLLVREL